MYMRQILPSKQCYIYHSITLSLSRLRLLKTYSRKKLCFPLPVCYEQGKYILWSHLFPRYCLGGYQPLREPADLRQWHDPGILRPGHGQHGSPCVCCGRGGVQTHVPVWYWLLGSLLGMVFRNIINVKLILSIEKTMGARWLEYWKNNGGKVIRTLKKQWWQGD